MADIIRITLPALNATTNILKSRLDNLFIPTKLSDLTQDSTHRIVTDNEKDIWNNKQDSLTFGILNTNNVIIDSSTIANGEYAKFTSNGLESKSIPELISDLGALTSLTGAILVDQTGHQTLGDTTNRLSKLWTTDVESTNLPTINGGTLASALGNYGEFLITSDISGKENSSNKVTSISAASTNIQYGSAKLLYDQLVLKLDTSLKGSVNGLAELDALGFVKNTQLPSYVDDVLEYTNFAAFPVTGETGKIYITLDDNKTYRWSGSIYAIISETLALGELDTTAYRGDRGKTAYDHTSLTNNPHSVTKAQIGLTSVTDNAQWYSGNHPISTFDYGLPAYPTTLPASDVYSWAKEATKPAYGWSEIESKPTTLSTIATNDLGNYGGFLTAQISHSDVVVDGDFTSQGIILRGISSGSYSILADNSLNWNSAYGWGNWASNFGSTTGKITQGDDSRLSDSRTPTSHVHGNITNDGLIGTTATLPIITGIGGILQVGSFGITTGTFAQGDDSRFTDSRTPNAHAFVDTTGHTVSGLTTGHFLKATGATTYAFGAHGLIYSDVGAEPAFSKNTGFNLNLGSVPGTVLEGRTFGTAAGSASTDFAPASVYPASGLTTGYLLYKTSTLLASSGFYWDAVNQRGGIGTTAPAYKLDVAGTLGTNGRATFGDAASSQSGSVVLNSLGTTGNMPNITLKSGGTQYGVMSLTGAILGTNATDVGIFAETGKTINLWANGQSTIGAEINSTGLAVTGTVDATGYKLSGVSTFLDWTRTGYAGTAGQILRQPTGNTTSPAWWTPDYPTISSGILAPTSTPEKIGDEYIDTVAKKIYKATGTTNSSDWTILN